MKIINLYLNNNFYFILFFTGITFISYFSIYDSLITDELSNTADEKIIVNSKYSLSVLKNGISSIYFMIPVKFTLFLLIFLVTQYISLYFSNLLKPVNSSNKFLTFSTFLIGCYFGYLLSIFLM